MKYSDYSTTESELPPNLEIGQVMQKVTRIEENTFELKGEQVKGMRIFADGKEYKTSSKPIMDKLRKFFEKHPKEVLEGVKVVQPKGKRYLTLESV